MSRPRVTAHYEREPFAAARNATGYKHTYPGVEITLTFDLHDHQSALTLLDHAVEGIRAQVAETGGQP